ncbi:MAG: PaaI family thioesterase [Eubacteriales bacterium]|nr:PaaI family thioesterase [Eubacteriales bacterium]
MAEKPVTQAGEILKAGIRGFDALIGSRIELIEPGRAVFTLKVEDRHLNPMGSLHGGVLLTMADTAAGCACAYEPTVCPTLEGKLNFLAPCFPGDTVRVEGHELRHGKTILACEVKAWNQHGNLVAAGLFSYIKSQKPMPREEMP